ncbi:MAG: YciI family protein [Nocardioides sp.]
MSKFVFIYHAPPMPADAPAPSQEEMQGVMRAWNDWAGRVGDGMVDFGTPLDGGVRVTPDGNSASDRQVTGYSIIEVADMDAALALAKGHPHLAMPGGCEIEVHEAQPIPGM